MAAVAVVGHVMTRVEQVVLEAVEMEKVNITLVVIMAQMVLEVVVAGYLGSQVVE